MPNQDQFEKISTGQGFIAALDQSGGSTPKALMNYGVDESAYETEEEMFALVHEMRTRIITSPSFTSEKILGAILFERTMDSTIDGLPTAEYLWSKLGVVPFLKIDKGLADEEFGVQVMKPMPDLEALLKRGSEAGIFGTKMRSVIHRASESGIAVAVAQQFEIAKTVQAFDMVPIIEPEVNIEAADKAEAEAVLKREILKHLDNVMGGKKIMLKLTLPEEGNFYAELIAHDKVARVVALSGGYSLDESCKRLAENEDMIASFSRALTNDLNHGQSADEFDNALANAIDHIYQASVAGQVSAAA